MKNISTPAEHPKLPLATLRRDFDGRVLELVEQWLPVMRVAVVLPVSVAIKAPCYWDATGKFPERWADRKNRRRTITSWPKLSERIVSFEEWSPTLPNRYDPGDPYVIVGEVVL